MCPSALWIGMSQMFAQAKLARRPARVKPERALAARNPSGRVENKQTQVVRRGNLKRSVLNDSNRPVRTRMPGGVGGVGQVIWPPLSRFLMGSACLAKRLAIRTHIVYRIRLPNRLYARGGYGQ